MPNNARILRNQPRAAAGLRRRTFGLSADREGECQNIASYDSAIRR